jgi:hypothetical protein
MIALPLFICCPRDRPTSASCLHSAISAGSRDTMTATRRDCAATRYAAGGETRGLRMSLHRSTVEITSTHCTYMHLAPSLEYNRDRHRYPAFMDPSSNMPTYNCTSSPERPSSLTRSYLRRLDGCSQGLCHHVSPSVPHHDGRLGRAMAKFAQVQLWLHAKHV